MGLLSKTGLTGSCRTKGTTYTYFMSWTTS
jgi:hypothetical protein